MPASQTPTLATETDAGGRQRRGGGGCQRSKAPVLDVISQDCGKKLGVGKTQAYVLSAFCKPCDLVLALHLSASQFPYLLNGHSNNGSQDHCEGHLSRCVRHELEI